MSSLVKLLMVGVLFFSGMVIVNTGAGVEFVSLAFAEEGAAKIEGGVPLISGNKALQVWDEAAMKNASPVLKAWLFFMTAVFAAGLLFIFHHKPARWLIGGFGLMVLAAVFIVPAMGLTMFSGLAALLHVIFWTPGLYLLLREAAFFKGISAYGVWSLIMVMVILISFVFDVRDATIYLDHMMGIGLLS